jgi:beta-lactamase regulating signal transducer with metallopeptidase domain
MAADLVVGLVRINLVASVMIVLALIARRPIRRLAGPRKTLGLWLSCPLAALASFTPLPASLSSVVGGPMQLRAASFEQHLAAVAPVAGFDLMTGLAVLWITGVFIMLAGVGALQIRGVAKLGRLRAEGGKTLRSNVAGFGPALIGALVPRLVLPADFEQRFDASERVIILAHEEAHLQARDVQLNALVWLCRCVCWFNPLVHIAAAAVRQDQELACDAVVIKRFPAARRTYAEALLKTQLDTAALPLGCRWPAHHGHPLKERIVFLRRDGPSPSRQRLGLALISASLLATTLAAWAAQPPASLASTATDQPPLRPWFRGQFNPAAPITVRANIVGVRTDGAVAFLMVRDSDGKRFKVMGGDPRSLPPSAVQILNHAVLSEAKVVIKGHEPLSADCTDGCLISGDEVRFESLSLRAPARRTPPAPA